MKRTFALPGARPQYAPDRKFDIEHYRIEVDLDFETRSIRGSCTITLAPLARGERLVELDAVELDVSEIRLAGKSDTGPLKFTNDGKVLRVALNAPAELGRSFDLRVEYSATPRRGLYFVSPDEAYPNKARQAWTQGQDQDSRYWFPCFDKPHEKASSEVIATVPEGMFALSNGSQISDATRDGRRTQHWRLDTPHSCYLVTLAAGDLSRTAEKWRDVEVTYYVERGREDDCRRTLGRTPEMLELFSKKFGVPYPYEKYAQVFVSDFIFGGMENTTATTLTDTILLDERAHLDRSFDDLVAHELAHQWFGDLITCRDWGQGWLNEGFATYSEYLWREHAEGRDAADMERDAWRTFYMAEDSSRYRRSVATNLYHAPIDVFDHHLYDKGALILHMLRTYLGDELYWHAIGHYLRKHRGSSVETRDLARALEEATGRVLDWFFDQWVLEGAGHPELEVSYAWDAERSAASITVVQTQDTNDSTPVFRLPLAVRFRVAGEGDQDVRFELAEKRQTFFFPLSREPEQIIFDPGKPTLAQVKFEKPAPVWQAELADATAAIDRIDAARALGKIGSRRAIDALARALREDSFWGVRAAAADALGAARTSRARQALVDALPATEHPKARRGVVRALGSFRRDDDAATALIGVVENGDASYFVEAEACLALGRTRADRAPEVLRSALDRDSFMDVIRQHVYRGLAEARDETALGLLVEATSYGREPHGRRAALAAAAQLARGRTDGPAQQLREHAEELLRDPDFRVQGAAIEALGTIGDPASVPALRATIERELDGRLIRRSKEVIRDIAEGRSHNQQLATLRDEIDQMRTDATAMRERLDKLELALEQASESGKSGKDKDKDKDKKKKKKTEKKKDK